MPILSVSLNSCIDRTLRADQLAIGAHLQVDCLSERPAGKGVNVARLLQQLGVPVRLIALAGCDRESLFRSALAGIELDLVLADTPTRVNTFLHDSEGREIHLRERGSPISALLLGEVLSRILAAAPGRLLVFSGSLPPGLSPNSFAAWIQSAQDRGATVAVDTSGPALHAAVEAGADLLKPNLEEAQQLLGTSTPPSLAELQAWAVAHPAITLLHSRGAEGAAWLRGPKMHCAHTEAPPPHHTLGAGDALLAAFLAAHYHEKQSPAAALKTATRIAAATLALPTAGDLPRGVLGVSDISS